MTVEVRDVVMFEAGQRDERSRIADWVSRHADRSCDIVTALLMFNEGNCPHFWPHDGVCDLCDAVVPLQNIGTSEQVPMSVLDELTSEAEKLGLYPPPHEGAKSHAAVMKHLRGMTKEELAATVPEQGEGENT